MTQLLPHGPEPVEVWSKSGSNQGHCTLAAETLFRSYLEFDFGEVGLISHMLLPTHAPQPVQVWSKSGSKQGHFTLVA